MTVFDINLPCVFLRELAVKVWSWAFVSEWFYPCPYFGARSRMQHVVSEHCRRDSYLQKGHLNNSALLGQTVCTVAEWLLMCCKEMTITSELIAHLICRYLLLRQAGCCSDKKEAFMAYPILQGGWSGCFFCGALPQISSLQQWDACFWRVAGGDVGEKKWPVRTVTLFCLKDAGVFCFGIPLFLYLLL